MPKKKTIKCIRCGKQFTPYRRNGVITSKKCIPCRGEVRANKMAQRAKKRRTETVKRQKKKKKEKKKESVPYLIKELDKVFSLYIRQSSADEYGNCECVSCGVVKPWKEMQAGHYVSRGEKNTRFDEENVHVQCAGCNIFRKGNYPKYTEFMLKKYGADKLQEIIKRGDTIKQFKPPELKELIQFYTNKL